MEEEQEILFLNGLLENLSVKYVISFYLILLKDFFILVQLFNY